MPNSTPQNCSSRMPPLLSDPAADRLLGRRCLVSGAVSLVLMGRWPTAATSCGFLVGQYCGLVVVTCS